MNQIAKRILENTGLCTVLAIAALVLLTTGVASAQITQYLDDGAVQNAKGGFDLPLQGYCWGDGAINPATATRPLCIAQRFNYATSPLCIAGTAPTIRTWSTGVCNDLINNTQPLCALQPDRMWNAATGVCAIVMNDDDRNDTVCALHRGTWVTSGACVGTWVMPPGSSYAADVLTWTGSATSAPGPGDQCLRCHNTRTQYNGPRVRDTEDTMFMGHKNMSRKVTVGMPWGGPAFHCINTTTGLPAPATAEEACYDLGFNFNWVPLAPYPGTDTGQDFHWDTGQVDLDTTILGTNYKDLLWIYADWLSAYPRAIYKDDPNTATNPDSPKVSYSCARCHTTGWTADTTVNYGMGGPGTSTREPEKSFPGVTWDGIADATYGQVNLAPGAPFNTKSASWDVWGISCTRCHNSAISRTSTATHGFSAAAGMSSHHNNLTAPDNSGGVCTDTRWTREFECTTNGGSWLTACSVNPTPAICTVNAGTTQALCEATVGNVWTNAAYCSNAFYNGNSAACVANGYVWNLGWCKSPTAPAGVPPAQTCVAGQTLRLNGSQASCQVAPATWAFSSCSLEGVCNDAAHVTSKAACNLAGGQFAYATDVIRCEDIGGKWTGTNSNHGQIITGLCMNCHRQEASGAPMDATNPAGNLKVGPYHSTVTFLSHPHANQFLNSPHGKFTGTFAQIPTGKFNYAGTGEYKSFFQVEGEANGTGNGCTGCHDVHTSTVTGEKPFSAECNECHAKDLTSMIHPAGAGTPLEEMGTDPMEPCVVCHMPAGEHLFRINTDAAYSTKPPGALTATVNANTAPDGNYPNAVWVDLDSACGKCHGGGIANVTSTGSIAAAAKLLTVATGQGATFTAGQRIKVVGAGSLYYDDDGTTKLNTDLESYIVSIAGDVLTLAGTATKTVTAAAVEQNPVANNAGYKTKATLALQAKGIHNDKPYVTFGYSLAPGNSLQVNVDASFSTCSGDIANCDAFVWTWGDGSPDSTTSTPMTAHIYATAGTKIITLTIHQYGVSEGSLSKKVRTFAVDAPPVAGGTACASIVNPNTWVASLTDNSTDPDGVKQVTVNWGDGTAISSQIDTTPPYSLIGTVFPHTYANAGSWTIKQTAYDTIGQANVRTCPPVVLSTFSLDGSVRRLNSTPVASATITIKLGAVTVRTVYSNTLGNYTVGNLKPGTYNVTATKAGLTFAQVYNQPVGPSASGLNFQSAQ